MSSANQSGEPTNARVAVQVQAVIATLHQD